MQTRIMYINNVKECGNELIREVGASIMVTGIMQTRIMYMENVKECGNELIQDTQVIERREKKD